MTKKKKKKNNNTSNNSVKHAFEARLRRKIAANPKLYLKPLKLRKSSSEEPYQMFKENWFFHDSSWSMHGLEAYEWQACNQVTGCVPQCRYYPQEGRIQQW
jgi:hypothetical protein